MLRSSANAAHEVWDVTDPAHPSGVRTGAGGNPVIGSPVKDVFDASGKRIGRTGSLAGTHKSWWECDTGIAYIVGRRGNDTASGWKPGNHIFVFDLGNPADPVFLRDWALDGQQPGGAPFHRRAHHPRPDLANTDLRCGPYQGDPNKRVQVVQTSNVATDGRGFVYIVDRADSGMHVLRFTGEAARIAGLGDED